MSQKFIFRLACFTMALSIILGAFAAHGLKDKLSPYQLNIFEKGIKYQIYHALALFILSFQFAYFNVTRLKTVGILFIAGMLLFSGSLYLLSTAELTGLKGITHVIGPLTPIGGVCYILGWVFLAFAWKK